MNFGKELELIETGEIREIVDTVLKLVPPYFYTIPASSSGKYHPTISLGVGGLYRHVRTAIVVAQHLFNMNEYKFSRVEKDIIIASLILHDCWKQGEFPEGNTVFEHPNIAAECISLFASHDYKTFHSLKHAWYVFLICLNVRSHMGQWNTSKYSGTHLMKPFTRMQKFVHLCDYISSRRGINIELEIE